MATPENPFLNIALVEPEIPHNTGNIGRTCLAMNCHLHLIGPLGFEISDKQLRRAGLDYWSDVKMTQYENFQSWEKQNPINRRFFFFTTKSRRRFFDVEFQVGDWLVFGPETRGLSAEILHAHADNAVSIPMLGETRSLNLSNAAAIAVYEAYRQCGKNYVRE